MPSGRTRAALQRAGRRTEIAEHHRHVAGDHVIERRQAAAIRHVRRLDPGHALEHLHVEMMRHARTDRRECQLAGIGLGIGDAARRPISPAASGLTISTNGVCASKSERHEIGQRLVRQALIERDIDRHGRRRRHQQRVAVGGGLLHRGRGDDRAGAGLVLDDEALAEPLLELCATIRASRSVPPPAANGLTMVTVRAG